MLGEIQGRTPSPLQLVSTYGLFVVTVGLVILHAGHGWKAILLAVLAGDWAAGIVANAAVSTRAWWRDRLHARRVFLFLHIAQIPIVWWLCDGDMTLFAVLMLALFAKLSVFLLGRETLES